MNRSQLTAETSTRASGYTNAFGYDGGTAGGPGNPTSFKGTTSAFNADNQVTNTGYGYDGNGSPTTYKSSALTFDPENRLASYTGTTYARRASEQNREMHGIFLGAGCGIIRP